MVRLLIVCMLTAFIHMINTLIYSVRVSGVITKRLAIALTLFNFIFMFSSMANTIQAPLMSSIVESAVNDGIQASGGISTANDLLETESYQQEIDSLELKIRIVLLAATLGTVLGAVLIPWFIRVFVKGIFLFEELGSIPKLLLLLLRPFKMKKMVRTLPPPPERQQDVNYKFSGLPRNFLILNFLVTGIYTIGVLAAMFAGALLPDYRSTATVMASVVNGLATVLFAMVVDPTAAMITDQALREERSVEDVRKMCKYLSLTRIGGNLLAQLLLYPAALVVVWVTKLII